MFKTRVRRSLGAAALFANILSPIKEAKSAPHPSSEGVMLAIGTYTQDPKGGICLTQFHPDTGQLERATVAAATPNPSFLTLRPDGKTLYAVNESGKIEGVDGGGVSAFAVDESRTKLTPINAVSSPGGLCHLSVDARGRFVLGAAYGSGTVSVWSLGTDGRIGPRVSFVQHDTTAAKPHAHEVVLSADNKHVFVPDLGLDKLMVYGFDHKAGALTPNQTPFVEMPQGSGPRHIAFTPSEHFAYVITEKGNSIEAFHFIKSNTSFEKIQSVSTLPEGFAGKSATAEIAVHPNGHFLFGSNRGHDSIVTYAIDSHSGQLKLIGFTPTEGRNPRHFTLDPSGKWLLAASQGDNSITVFRVDTHTGTLTKTSQLKNIPGAPVCLCFLPAH